MINKLTLTQQLIKQLDDNQQPTVERAMQYWWFNIRNNGGLRLTDAGFYIFQDLNIEGYKFDLPEHITLSGKLLLALDKKLTCPYFINIGKLKYLMLYGGREATMLTLYGNIQQFIDSLLQH